MAILAPAGILTLTACRDQDAAPKDIAPAVIGTTTVAGQNLGPEATPHQVVFALLSLLRDDAKASQSYDAATYKKLLAQELQLSAPRRIYRNVHGQASADALQPAEMHDAVYKRVRLWTPIVGRYVDNFKEDANAMIAAMRTKAIGEDVRVSLDVADPQDGTKVVLQVYLCREPDNAKSATYWRVFKFGYAPHGNDDAVPTTKPAAAAQTRPTTTPASK